MRDSRIQAFHSCLGKNPSLQGTLRWAPSETCRQTLGGGAIQNSGPVRTNGGLNGPMHQRHGMHASALNLHKRDLNKKPRFCNTSTFLAAMIGRNQGWIDIFCKHEMEPGNCILPSLSLDCCQCCKSCLLIVHLAQMG